jgi:hypothetical protein
LNAIYKTAFVIALMLLLSFSATAQSGFDLKIGPSKAAIIGAAVGVGAGITVVVLYFALRNPVITGCVQSANGTSSLTDDKDHRSYVLVDEGSELKAGQRVKLQGKKKKDKQGKITLRVAKIRKDYGACQQ